MRTSRDALGGGRDHVSALEKGLQAIEAFEAAEPAMTLTEVAHRAGLSRAAARRYLLTLARLGYMEFDGKRFRLGPRTAKLGRAYFSSASLAKLAQPILERVGEITREGVSLGILDRDNVVYIGQSSPRRIMTGVVNVGVRVPAVVAGTGRVLLASKPDEEVVEMLRQVQPIQPLTSKTKTDIDEIFAEICFARTQGYSINDEEIEIGLHSITVPVQSRIGAVVAAMSVSAPPGRMPPPYLIEIVLPVLQEASQALGALL